MGTVLLNDLKKVFSVFNFNGTIFQNDEDSFVLRMKCDTEYLSNFEKDWIFQDIEKAFNRSHPWRELERVKGLEIVFEIDGVGNYLVFENHCDNYSECSTI